MNAVAVSLFVLGAFAIAVPVGVAMEPPPRWPVLGAMVAGFVVGGLLVAAGALCAANA